MFSIFLYFCVDVLTQLHLFLPLTHLVIYMFVGERIRNESFCLRGQFRLLVENYSKRFNSSACNKHGEDSNVRGFWFVRKSLENLKTSSVYDRSCLKHI